MGFPDEHPDERGPMTTRYSELMAAVQLQPGACSVEVPDDWTQGRSVFGGLQSALALRAMRTLVAQDVPLRTLQTTFIAPVPPGPVRAEARVLRTGKSASHVEARLVEGGDTLALVTAVFGQARPSAVTVAPTQSEVPCERPVPLRYVPGVTPSFTRHFVAAWRRGGLPFSGNPLPEAVVDLAMNDTGTATEAHVLAIADLIPPVALSILKTPAPGSSLTWMLEFFTDRYDHLPLQGWRVDAKLVAARDGYTSQSTMVWGPGGVPVAISRQSMVVFG
jgi:acyl-CoA thioesterase